MPPIRILHVVGGLEIGGIENLIMSLYRQIDRDVVQFDFVKHSPSPGFFEEEATSLGSRLYVAPRYKGINHISYLSWWNAFYEAHPEYCCIHGHMRSTASLYLRSAKQHGRLTICHSHSTSDGEGLQAVVKKLFYKNLNSVSDYRFACSKEAGDFLFGENEYGKSVIIFPNAIDCNRMQFSQENREKIRRKYGFDNNAFVIGAVGRLTALKNHSFLLDVFNVITKRCPTAKLLIVGDGPMREELEHKCQQLNLRQNVVFAGPTSDVSGHLSALDVFAFPSEYEGFGNALIEAQANGLPCVASDNVPKNTNVTDRVRYVSLDESATKWAECLLACSEIACCNRNDYANKVSNAGYDIKKVAKRLTDFYLRIYSGESMKGIEF